MNKYTMMFAPLSLAHSLSRQCEYPCVRMPCARTVLGAGDMHLRRQNERGDLAGVARPAAVRVRTRVSERAQDQARNALITLGRGNPKYAQVARSNATQRSIAHATQRRAEQRIGVWPTGRSCTTRSRRC